MAKVWSQECLSWEELANRLGTPRRATTTSLAYWQADKATRDKYKDVGGFVGGVLTQGLRRKGAVEYRTLITLDIDSGDEDTLETIRRELDGLTWLIYSTMSHTDSKPRYRLIMPMSRRCSPGEYEALARRIAGDIDIEAFDDTTYQPERLMYWPNVCSDAEYIFECHDGALVDVDRMLDSYTAWQDVSEWPHSKRVAQVIQRANEALGDPREKPGIIGAFCRAYSISDVMHEFLRHVYRYEPRHKDRYTYIDGSAVCGVVVYDDQLAYSHHGTDPASGQSLNAYDLVRIHKFGNLDDGVEPTTRIDRRPSSKAMDEWAMTLAKVRAQRVKDIAGDFDDITPEADDDTTKAKKSQKRPASASVEPDGKAEDSDAWMAKLDITKKGGVANTANNVLIILQNDEALRNKMYRDEFTGKDYVTSAVPWRSADRLGEWTDTDDSGLRLYIENKYGIASNQKVLDALEVVMEGLRRHPIKEFITAVQWDGVPRIDSLFIDYLGAIDTPLIRAMTRKSLTAGVARIFEPGCKYDQIVTLAGREGIGKSTLLRNLGGRWYNDSFVTVEGKEAMEQLAGAWIIEIAELAGLRKAEVASVKAFVSKQEDIFRAAYARRTKSRPRQCVFFATTNESDFLRDETGNRRFWIVPVGENEATKSPWDISKETIAQVWAEAYAAYKAGETLYLGKEYAGGIQELHKQFTEQDPRLGIIQAYLDKPLPLGFYTWTAERRRLFIQEQDGAGGFPGFDQIERTTISVPEILNECFPVKIEANRRNSLEMVRILAKLEGWKKCEERRFDKAYGQQRIWVRNSAED